MTLVIGLLGGGGAGKSTIARYLAEKYGARRYAFADPLKALIKEAFELENAQVHGTQDQKDAVDTRYNLSGRDLAKRIGQAVRLVWGANFWWTGCLQTIALDNPDVAVIEDVRYVNESEGVLTFGKHWSERRGRSVVWRVEHPNGPKYDASHPSEAEWTRAPYTSLIRPNRVDIEELYALVDERFKEIS